jgi:uncharacterized damage-inducible protein DinB
MMRIDEITQLYAYNRWATDRVLEAVSALSPDQFRQDMGSSFPSIRDTLVHIMSAEWVWLSRLQGSSPAAMPESWKEMNLDHVEREWAQLDRAIRDLVGRLNESELDQPVSYRNIAGEPQISTRAQILRHVVNHSSYHRGQVTTMLRQLGVAATSTDLILYYRTELVVNPA